MNKTPDELFQTQTSVDVNGSSFMWDTSKGVFQFEGGDVMLFWIDSAFKVFLDSIEEITGEGTADLVYETAGYRTGLVVSDFYKNKIGDIKKALEALPNTYVAAGWGKTFIEVDIEKKEAVISISNSWETKVKKAQGSNRMGRFLPGHWAGVLTGLFDTHMWYEILRDESPDILKIKITETDITPNDNIRDLVQREEQNEIMKLEAMVENRTRELTDLIREISSPIIPVTDHIVVIPLIGKYNELRSKDMLEHTLTSLPQHRAKFVILDLTGIKSINSELIDMLNKLVSSARLFGMETLLVGISPELSMEVTKHQYSLGDSTYFRNLKHAIHFAFAKEGMFIQEPNQP
ncbi:STAS domain-containing protein [Fictibacillus phosphorivorans]|uniref:STAS domain-containing protein n=1 Tax=Fictibacillus phosphorivorans TaxID=1221500 RepID=UPI00203B8496|nr:STAS domain-containing protein [Fictibacillus phosphorivorans]MCM3717646.1 STAS domain-containing protein [Fictibacillus phosphorivorans]MCM3775546.1 STAS domain-containing protein [Fictibacillus phosphorivorans]